MKVWNSFPVLRLVVPFIAGVVSWAFIIEFVSVQILTYAFGVLTAAIVLCLILLLSIKFGRRPHAFGVIALPSFYVLGGLLTLSISNYIFPQSLQQTFTEAHTALYLAVIADEPQEKQRTVKVTAKVARTDLTAHGKVLLYFEKDSLSKSLTRGQEILVYTTLQPIQGMGNPNEFNYSRYLRFHNIAFRGHVKSGNSQHLSKGKPGVIGWFLALRSKLITVLKEAGLKDDELAVASALVLGHRTELDKELMSAYAGAGATHVLAVSGLHVGIVYVILNGMLGFMNRTKRLRILKTVLLILLLAAYAALTGLSPSVSRAAVMFSVVAIGKAINRNTDIFNSLAISAFILIVFFPLMVMQVGFQLSYLAVIGIVLIHPMLFSLTFFNNRILDWAWSITCVSIAAQIATAPLGLLYFHQFPNLFFVSNLLVIPAAAVILYVGFAVFICSVWQPLLLVAGFLLKWVIRILNWVVVSIEQIPFSVLKGIDISTFEALLIYGTIASVLVLLVHKQRWAIYTGLSFSIVFMALQVIEVHKQKTQQFMAVYNVRNETVIALVNGTDLTVIASKKFWEDEQAKLFHVQHHWWNRGIETEDFIELTDSLYNRRLNWNGISFAIMDLHSRENKKVTWTGEQPIDYAILSLCDWQNCTFLKELDAETIVIPNSYGPKMMERIQSFTKHKSTISIAQSGMVKL